MSNCRPNTFFQFLERKPAATNVIIMKADRFDIKRKRVLEDIRLVWQLKRGDTHALRRIYCKYEHDLLTLAANLLGDINPAEDVLQDVFIRFIESIDSFRLTGSLRGYLAKCTLNRARDYLRKANRLSMVPIEAADSAESLIKGPVQLTITNEQNECVTTVLGELPYEQREVVVLHLQGSLTFREIAHLQNVSAKTTESRYRYGINKLRSILNGQVKP
jgi:RNA polymerase sigma factor (sigma-70 family)